MEPTTRYSTYSLTADRIPEWLNDEPFDFNDTHVPPSYLIASLQEAFNEPLYDSEPPTYDHTIAASNGTSRHRLSIAGESMWDDEDEDDSDNDETSEPDAHDDDEDGDEEMQYGDVGSVANPRFAGLWTDSVIDRIADDHKSASTPTASSSSRSSVPSSSKGPSLHSTLDSHITYPSAYHLLHLHSLSWLGLRESLCSNHDLASCLASLDSQLLEAPFSAFADVCYEASVLGDTSPGPTRPFSPSPRNVRALPPLPVQPSPLASHAAEDDDDSDEDDDDDDEVPRSPAQTLNVIASPPFIWDPKVEEHSRSRSELPISMSRSNLSTPYFLPPPQHVLSSPMREDRRSAAEKSERADAMAEVAALFLRGPIHVGSGETVHASPTRPEVSKRSRSSSRPRTNGSIKVKGFLRSLNISQPRWLPS